MMTNKHYIPSIDGLRAIAVLIVILYHLDIELLKGGFIGVDVFFVISGFLITRNILTAQEKNSFSFKQFYLARLRRLYPALLTTILISCAIAFLLFSPGHLIETSSSAIAATLSFANIYFWNSAGYFDTQATFKPLLHYWSLSVEEQFYLFWPAFLLLLLSITKSAKKQKIFIFLLILISLTYTEFLLSKDPDLAFYWFHSRIYEFLIGSILVGYSSKNLTSTTQFVLTLSGLIVIFTTAITYKNSTEFPGINALLPCIGAALLIYTREFSFTKLALANKPMRWVGKLSYSLYLVHWPIWVFYGYWKFEPITNIEKAVLFLSILIFGYLLYITIEKPFRQNSSTTKSHKRFLFIVLSISILICGVNYKVIKEDGMRWRLKSLDTSNQQKKPTCPVIKNTNNKIKEKKCNIGNISNPTRKVLLIGDSHAEHLTTGLERLAKKHNIQINVWTFSGCPPIWNTHKVYGLGSSNVGFKEKHCKSLIKEWKNEVNKGNYDTVILASRWAWLFEPTKYGSHRKQFRRFLLVENESPKITVPDSRFTFKEKLKATVDEIVSKTHTNVIIFSQAPLLANNIQGCDRVPKYLLNSNMVARRCSPGIEYSLMLERLNYSNNIIRELKSPKVLPIVPSDLLCSNSSKKCITVFEKKSIYADDNHLNTNGSLHLISSYEDKIIKFITQSNTQ